MAQKRNLTGSGLAAAAAEFIVGKCASGLTATGTSTTDALPLVDVNEFTTVASSTGALLPSGASPGDLVTLYNIGAQTLTVYPPTGEAINNAASSYTVATTKVALFQKVSATRWCAGVLA